MAETDRARQGRLGRSRGNGREVKVIEYLQERGWLCGSRRHIGGAGDILAVRHDGRGVSPLGLEVLLIEVKSTARPWEKCGPNDREALVRAAVFAWSGALPVLAHWPKHGQLRWYSVADRKPFEGTEWP